MILSLQWFFLIPCNYLNKHIYVFKFQWNVNKQNDQTWLGIPVLLSFISVYDTSQLFWVKFCDLYVGIVYNFMVYIHPLYNKKNISGNFFFFWIRFDKSVPYTKVLSSMWLHIKIFFIAVLIIQSKWEKTSKYILY
jgi:hypothetical protein